MRKTVKRRYRNKRKSIKRKRVGGGFFRSKRNWIDLLENYKSEECFDTLNGPDTIWTKRKTRSCEHILNRLLGNNDIIDTFGEAKMKTEFYDTNPDSRIRNNLGLNNHTNNKIYNTNYCKRKTHNNDLCEVTKNYINQYIKEDSRFLSSTDHHDINVALTHDLWQ